MTTEVYQALARKYRPKDLEGLIGQDALVRTLRNSIASGRIAQAYMLTGIRGVGKTTTARIIARALNCDTGPTATPCGVCRQCLAVGSDGNMDVFEMDAASRTGVDDIREIIDGVRYAPTVSRYKIYIIDEVHMLSKSAFNALLKTLEEPPPHVKFIFATTEIRKVPVTVLSRCQRFDLKRVDIPVLKPHLAAIAGQEGVALDDDAAYAIARAADGSVRDSLSLLDQAIARADGRVTAAIVADMLGTADRTAVMGLAESALTGDATGAVATARRLVAAGADALTIVRDLMDFTHFVAMAATDPKFAQDSIVPEAERVRGLELAPRVGLARLQAAWAVLVKAIADVQATPSPERTLEMALVRIAHPTPAR